MTKEIYLIDCTLREGNQAHGALFNVKNSSEIAEVISELGVDTLEVGHPVCSELEMNRVKAIANLNLPCSIMAHARALEKDVLAAYESGASWIGIFAGINEHSQKARLNNRSKNEIIARVQQAIILAKKYGLKVRYTVEDSSRTSMDLLVDAYKAAIQVGADRVCYSDTVGVLEPSEVTKNINFLHNYFPGYPIEVHFHDDRGLALANTLAALDAGANWVSSSINGLGERSGITDTCVMLANLTYRKNNKFKNIEKLRKVSRFVGAHTRNHADFRRPVIGKYAFNHKARLHVNAIEVDENTYSWISPKIFGLKTTHSLPELPRENKMLINYAPKIIPSSELRYHTDGPGDRYVMLDERVIQDCRQYCIVRSVSLDNAKDIKPHVDIHRHECDSLFMFLGKNNNLEGLTVQVQLEDEVFLVNSPSSVFIPAGMKHSYQFISGHGVFINHVLSGTYNESLLD